MTDHKAILDALPCAVLVYDLDTVLYANKEALAALDASMPSDVIGRNVEDLAHPSMVDLSRERRRLQIEQRQCFRDLHVLARSLDGRDVRYVVDSVVIDTPSGPAICVTGRAET